MHNRPSTSSSYFLFLFLFLFLFFFFFFLFFLSPTPTPLTVDFGKGLLAIEPYLIGSDSNHGSIDLVEGLSQVQHAAVTSMIRIPYIGNGRELRTRDIG